MVERRMQKIRGYMIAFSVAAMTLVATSCLSTNAPDFDGKDGVIVTVVFDGHPADTMDVAVTDPTTANAALQFISSGSGPHIFFGPIVKGVGYDLKYAFHFIPDSVRVNDDVLASCDAAPMHSVTEVSSFFITETGSANTASAPWCPSTSRPIAMSAVLKIGNSSR
jgi:hypothetical protein